MAAYTYKYVRDLIPPYVKETFDDYDGDANYDGDQWSAAEEYIKDLEAELSNQFKKTKSLRNEKLLDWLKTRPDTFYCDGPVIVDESDANKHNEHYGRRDQLPAG